MGVQHWSVLSSMHNMFLIRHIFCKQENDNLQFHDQQHISASMGNEQCVKLLLEFGADPNARGKAYN
jgi:ankyrin repeat protein